jgi:AcrR family transcriptional regulator
VPSEASSSLELERRLGRREENKRIKRGRIEAEALGLFLANGFERTSIEQIVACSEIARGTFYLYFVDKESLFFSLTDVVFNQMMALLEGVALRISQAETAVEGLEIYREMALGLGAIALAHPQQLMLIFRESRQPGPAGAGLRERELRLQSVVVNFTTCAVERGLVQIAHPEVTVLVIYGAIERLYYEFMVGRDMGDVDVLAHEVLALFGRTMGLPIDEAL